LEASSIKMLNLQLVLATFMPLQGIKHQDVEFTAFHLTTSALASHQASSSRMLNNSFFLATFLLP
jgi:hypothetical protein